jgi:LysM repeat protein
MFREILITTTLLAFSVSVAFAQNERKSLKDTITDKHIVVPPQIERNFDDLFVEWNKNIKAPKDCNVNSEENISYPDSVYINRLYCLPTEMELAYNPIVKSYIDMYSGRRRRQVSYMLAEGKYYFPMFESILDKYGLPLELKFLPVIESALKPVAVSHAGATGLWQFMLGTGKMYNLEVNSLVDERRDPLKASDAAARYLKDLYGMYGDWNLVIAAYNCGPGNVNKAIRRSNGQTDYWAIYPYLPKETRGYVPAFIAATYIMSYYKEHNICPMEYSYPVAMDTIAVNKTIHFQQIADILKVSIDDVRDLNPQYKKDIIPGDYKQYIVSLPSTKIADFVSLHDTIVAHRNQELLVHRKTVDVNTGEKEVISTRKVIHKVKKGETLAAIAKKHGVSSSQIKKWNKLKSNKLAAGSRLTINKPVYGKAAPTQSKSAQGQAVAENTKKAQQEANESESGEPSGNSTVIADYLKKQIENVTDAEVKEVKRIDPGVSNKTIYHKVRIGETLTQIANKYNVKKKDLMKWNKLSANTVKVGQRLIIYIPEKKQELVASAATTSKSETAKTATTAKAETTAKTKTEPKPKQTTQKKTRTYEVQKGDNLYRIATKYSGISADDIRKANKLPDDKLSIGQKLVIPQPK